MKAPQAAFGHLARFPAAAALTRSLCWQFGQVIRMLLSALMRTSAAERPRSAARPAPESCGSQKANMRAGPAAADRSASGVARHLCHSGRGVGVAARQTHGEGGFPPVAMDLDVTAMCPRDFAHDEQSQPEATLVVPVPDLLPKNWRPRTPG